jgi:hypothetical protein
MSFCALLDLSAGGFDNRKRISAAEILQVEMEVQPRFIGKALQEGPITVFARPLATYEESAPGRNSRSLPTHPTCGTAPYTPPRYFLYKL